MGLPRHKSYAPNEVRTHNILDMENYAKYCKDNNILDFFWNKNIKALMKNNVVKFIGFGLYLFLDIISDGIIDGNMIGIIPNA